MTFMTTELLIDNRPCMVYAMPEPRCLVLTTLGAHERKDFETLAQMIAKHTSVPFVLAAFTVTDWKAELAPWADSALSRRQEVGTQAGATLDFVANALLPEMQGLYGTLGEEHTALVWHNGGHFTDCTLRLAQAFAWCINRITTL